MTFGHTRLSSPCPTARAALPINSSATCATVSICLNVLDTALKRCTRACFVKLLVLFRERTSTWIIDLVDGSFIAGLAGQKNLRLFVGYVVSMICIFLLVLLKAATTCPCVRKFQMTARLLTKHLIFARYVFIPLWAPYCVLFAHVSLWLSWGMEGWRPRNAVCKCKRVGKRHHILFTTHVPALLLQLNSSVTIHTHGEVIHMSEPLNMSNIMTLRMLICGMSLMTFHPFDILLTLSRKHRCHARLPSQATVPSRLRYRPRTLDRPRWPRLELQSHCFLWLQPPDGQRRHSWAGLSGGLEGHCQDGPQVRIYCHAIWFSPWTQLMVCLPSAHMFFKCLRLTSFQLPNSHRDLFEQWMIPLLLLCNRSLSPCHWDSCFGSRNRSCTPAYQQSRRFV